MNAMLEAPLSYDDEVTRTFSKMNSGNDGMVHAAIGLAGETGELIDCLKKSLVYGRELHTANLIEELGDLEWYAAAMRSVFGLTRGECLNLRPWVMAPESANPVQVGMFAASKLNHAMATLLSQSTDIWAGGDEMPQKYVIAVALAHYEVWMEVLYAVFSLERDYVLAANVAKLRKRYPEGYTAAAALARADKQVNEEKEAA